MVFVVLLIKMGRSNLFILSLMMTRMTSIAAMTSFLIINMMAMRIKPVHLVSLRTLTHEITLPLTLLLTLLMQLIEIPRHINHKQHHLLQININLETRSSGRSNRISQPTRNHPNGPPQKRPKPPNWKCAPLLSSNFFNLFTKNVKIIGEICRQRERPPIQLIPGQ